MRLTILSLIVLLSVQVNAQNGWNWGEDKEECQHKWMFLSTSVKAEQYKEARPALAYLLDQAPNLNKALYQYGTKVYENLVKTEKDPGKLKQLQDSLLILYDARMKLYGEENTVMSYKGIYAYNFLIGRTDRRDELYPLYKKIYELNGANTKYYNIYYYYLTAGRECKYKRMTQDEFLTLHETLVASLDKQIAANNSYSKNASVYKEKIEAKLTSYVTLDCEFINKVYTPKFESEPSLEIAKKLYNLLLSQECISDPIFMKVSEYVMDKEPNYAGIRVQAKLHLRNKEYDKAITNFEKAIPLAKDDESKGKTFMDIAEIYKQKKEYSKAREYAYKNLEVVPDNADAYVFIGNLYLYSESCKNSSDKLKGSLIYIAAYDKYKKAGNSSKMSEARKYFPSMEQIFSRGKKEGDVMNTGCWVSENVSLRKK